MKLISPLERLTTSFSLEASPDEFCQVESGVRVCYRTYGPATGEPLLLIAGLGLQLISWPARLIEGLVTRGYRVIVFDNRDAGRSSCIDQPAPGLLRQLVRRASKSAYDLADMAEDAVGLLDHLEVPRAHIAGMSMGGMIAQTVAARHPHRVRSLISIFSTTGALKVGQPALSSMLMLIKAPVQRREDAIERLCALVRHIGPTSYQVDDAGLRAYAGRAWDRGQLARDSNGMGRQIGAIMKSGDRTKEIARIQAPTLVVHGDRDLMVAPSGGLATARAIAGAELITIRGMGHWIPDGVVPVLMSLIDGHARRERDNAVMR